MRKPGYASVIVGAGSAGCAPAVRQSGNEGLSVLVLAAGREAPGSKLQIPFGIGKLLANLKIIWPLETDFEQNMKQRRCCINAQIHEQV